MPEYLISFNDEWVQPHTPDEIARKSVASRAVVQQMRDEGVLLFSNGGIDESTVVCHVTTEGGKPIVCDGPYIETKEHLGGFAVIDVPDDDTARDWAVRLAESLDWPQEVHRFPGRGEHRA